MSAIPFKHHPQFRFAIVFFIACRFFQSHGVVSGDEVTITLAAYSTPREALRKVIPAFQKNWRDKTGRNIRFEESYQGSGAQSRAIEAGFAADVAILSLACDVDRLQEAGLVTHDWRSRSFGGMITESVVAFAFREGNPKNISDWSDLTSQKLEILAANPKSSGGAMWNVAAAYGSAARGTVPGYEANETGGRLLLKEIFRNVTVMDKSARDSIINFERGIGDVLITYENEILAGKAAGEIYDYTVPSSSIRIENPAVLVDRYADEHGVRVEAEAFLLYLWSPEAQDIFTKAGFRPVLPEAWERYKDRFKPVKDVWKIDFLGGWSKVLEKFFGPRGVFTLMMEEIQKEK